ncbi:unnamed protein product [Vitrella brassicaformis CCMP3155]|uniref:Uncharacterized protein n=1 Tax=Vitrella brassicaformis (strain CCMP3155) TaxID=1169540 RepID=A0A0G4GZ63_VITBC|nr:unnamed protein product [Vitrella brassicaformis CCMP3155]|eukprot:CEM36366.1 unnamed protein product [Vitrella brassicaformis CCMP3155]
MEGGAVGTPQRPAAVSGRIGDGWPEEMFRTPDNAASAQPWERAERGRPLRVWAGGGRKRVWAVPSRTSGPPNARVYAPAVLTTGEINTLKAIDAVCEANPNVRDHRREGDHIVLTVGEREVRFWSQEQRKKGGCYDLSCGFKATNMAMGSLTLPKHLFRMTSGRADGLPPQPGAAVPWYKADCGKHATNIAMGYQVVELRAMASRGSRGPSGRPLRTTSGSTWPTSRTQHFEKLKKPCTELGGIKGKSVAEKIELLTAHWERERGAVVAMLLRERAQAMDHFVAIKPQADRLWADCDSIKERRQPHELMIASELVARVENADGNRVIFPDAQAFAPVKRDHDTIVMDLEVVFGDVTKIYDQAAPCGSFQGREETAVLLHYSLWRHA